jgi:hypothetical protein
LDPWPPLKAILLAANEIVNHKMGRSGDTIFALAAKIVAQFICE